MPSSTELAPNGLCQDLGRKARRSRPSHTKAKKDGLGDCGLDVFMCPGERAIGRLECQRQDFLKGGLEMLQNPRGSIAWGGAGSTDVGAPFSQCSGRTLLQEGSEAGRWGVLTSCPGEPGPCGLTALHLRASVRSYPAFPSHSGANP